MKITAVETVRLTDRPNLIWVRLHTNEGLVGLGETWFLPGPVEAVIHDGMAPVLLGADARAIEKLSRAIVPYVGASGSSAEMRAASAVDVALWDLAGQAAGRPIYELLGGPVRSAIKVYNTCAGPDYVSKTAAVRPENFGLSASGPAAGTRFEDLDAFLNRADELAAELLEMGIQAMKIWPFDFTEGAADGLAISAADLSKALVPFEKVRAAHGDRMRVKAELHGLWSLPAARQIAVALEPLDIDWIEDPIWMDRLTDIGALAASTTIPLAGGETLGGLGQVRDLIVHGQVSKPIVDVTWGGGVTFAKKAAALAEAYALPIAFHECSGPVTLASSVHMALACPNVDEQEITRGFYYGWYHELVDNLPPLTNGMITAPDGPGLGLALLQDLSNRETAVVRVSRA